MSRFSVGSKVLIDIIFEPEKGMKCYAEIETTVKAIIRANNTTSVYFNLPRSFPVALSLSGPAVGSADSVEVDGENFCIKTEGPDLRSEVKAVLKLGTGSFQLSATVKHICMTRIEL